MSHQLLAEQLQLVLQVSQDPIFGLFSASLDQAVVEYLKVEELRFPYSSFRLQTSRRLAEQLVPLLSWCFEVATIRVV